MKRLWAGSLLLIFLLGASCLNARILESKIDDLLFQTQRSRSYVDQSDYETAAETLESAIDQWRETERFAHIFTRHTETDNVSDAFAELLAYLREKNDGYDGVYEKLVFHLNSLNRLEHLHPDTLF